MKKERVYMNNWLEIHPYKKPAESDNYYLKLCNDIFCCVSTDNTPIETKIKCAIYTCAYLEDIVSELGIWNAFSNECYNLYNRQIPFYKIGPDYIKGEVNKEDIRFIIWNILYKANDTGIPVNPMDESILNSASKIYDIIFKEYETAPENESIKNYFNDYNDFTDARHKIEWLFGHTYITRPSVEAFNNKLSENDRYIVPCGPLALFIYEWLELLCTRDIEKWEKIPGLFHDAPHIPEEIKKRNNETFTNFINGNNNENIAYIKGYDELKKFFVSVLKWPDDDNHTLPQMKKFDNFVLLCNKEKGLLLAHDICQCIDDPLNKYYNKEEAAKEDFTLLTIPTKCPPDLLNHIIKNNYIPDLQFPVYGLRELAIENADFIARCSLLYYYRGD